MASSDTSRGLSSGLNAPDLSASFPSPVLLASWSLLLADLFIACCSWLYLTFHFSRLVLYDGAFPFFLPVVAASPVVHSGACPFPLLMKSHIPAWLGLSSCFLFKNVNSSLFREVPGKPTSLSQGVDKNMKD